MRSTELKKQRDRDFYEVYIRGIEEHHFLRSDDALDYARLQPAPRYYISARAATLLLYKIESGQDLGNINEQSYRRFMQLYSDYLDYRAAFPDDTRSREQIMELLIQRPAPDFFIGKPMAKLIVLRERHAAMERMLNKRNGR